MGGPAAIHLPSGVSCVFFACVERDFEYYPLLPATGTVTCGGGWSLIYDVSVMHAISLFAVVFYHVIVDLNTHLIPFSAAQAMSV